ncbi:hypothetical protein DAPPUDRAFT_246411 [Daphnia pulex]|uniref:Uncharacterized protein n=1 Tax=Daphnia pulex TaxID=6669 RepID=E9GQF4_DAPPU|nr:hypothetical protein DAPPUDRAFT_246411 [Daphnia pulex]|eukprot:EFX78346.1 hypothetical protein DAPPUDRAFT_246411 [Daphnia pulex]
MVLSRSSVSSKTEEILFASFHIAVTTCGQEIAATQVVVMDITWVSGLPLAAYFNTATSRYLSWVSQVSIADLDLMDLLDELVAIEVVYDVDNAK